MCLDLLLITIIIVFIIDNSGVIDSIEKGLSKWLKAKVIVPKPFSCSLCSSWWVGLIYLIINKELTLVYIAYLTILSYLTPIICDTYVLIREILNWLMGKVFDTLKL